MQFVSMEFLIFFLISILVFCILPARLRPFSLLVSNLFFYMSWSYKFTVVLLVVSFLAWIAGLIIERVKYTNKAVFVLCILMVASALFYFKYYNFTVRVFQNIGIVSSAGVGSFLKEKNIIIPIGISFYTIQLIGYMADVYKHKIKAEHNYFWFLLFASFFPILLSGPIERAGHLLPQMHAVTKKTRSEILQPERIRDGSILMIWGVFLKLVVAERLSIFVDSVFSEYYMCGSVMLILAAIGYTLQIYCDFSSYSLIAFGAAKVLDFRITENFNAPYFSVSVTDFWRKWHVSFSTWLKDYIYIPLGGNRKGKLRKYLNILLTFTVSGLWHGAGWTYIFWGFLHGIYLIVENLLRPSAHRIRSVFKIRTDSFGCLFCRRIVTFLLVSFAWIFFRAESIHQAFFYIRRIFRQYDAWVLSGDQIFNYGLKAGEIGILAAGLLLLLFVDEVRMRKGQMLDTWLSSQWTGFRLLFVLFIAVSSVLFGIYGPGFHSGEFIYMKF
jgi:alginate O-acetyltransferase complex protein AlgI